MIRVSTCEINTTTPDFLEVSGDCSQGVTVNFVGEFIDPDVCDDLTLVAIEPSTRILIDGCGFTTIDTLCSAVQACIDSSGLRGPRGRRGSDACDGLSGIIGISGIDGQDGCDGRDGMDGADGIDGIDGVDGGDGADGSNGTDGTDAGVPIRPNDRVPIAGWRGSQQGNTVLSDGLTLDSFMNGLFCYLLDTPRPDTNYEVVVSSNHAQNSELFVSVSSKTSAGFCISAIPAEVAQTENFNVVVYVPRGTE